MSHLPSILPLLLAGLSPVSVSADILLPDPSYGRIPLSFTINEGQTADNVAFLSSRGGSSAFFTATGTTYVLSRETRESTAKRASLDPHERRDIPAEHESFALTCSFVGANANPAIRGEGRQSWNCNYFIGNDPDRWRTDVPNFERIRIEELYDGIDLVYHGADGAMKYDFIVSPGTNPDVIRLRYDFGDEGGVLSINSQKELVASTTGGEIVERAPYAYQRINGREIPVDVSYRIIDADAGLYGFTPGEYDPKHALVIDPELVLTYSTYLGGSTMTGCTVWRWMVKGVSILRGNLVPEIFR